VHSHNVCNALNMMCLIVCKQECL